MNCERFQKNLLEYLDESLSSSDMMAARAHLAGCSICRKVLQRELALAQSFSSRMEQAVEKVTLEPHVRRAMVAAMEREAATSHTASTISLWQRLILPFATVMTVVLVTFWTGRRYMAGTSKDMPNTAANAGEQQVFINVTYSAPVYTFQEKGDTVMDALTTAPRVADGTLLVKEQEPTKNNQL